MRCSPLNTVPVAENKRIVLETSGILPMVALLIAALLWGGSFAAMRLSVQAISPWSVMWLRMAIALAVVLPFIRRLKADAYRKGDWRWLVPMVLCQPCLYFLLESYALTYTASSQAGVISASVPVMVMVGAWLLLAEPLGVRTSVGLCLSVGGVIALSLLGDAAGPASRPLLGNLLELIAMVATAVNIILVKKLSHRYNPWLLTTLQVVAGFLFFSPGLVLLVRQDVLTWTPALFFSIAFLGAPVTLGAFGLYNWAMSRIPASRASVFINLVPVTAVVLGWTVMGESLNGLQCVAAGAVVAGVIISQKGPL